MPKDWLGDHLGFSFLLLLPSPTSTEPFFSEGLGEGAHEGSGGWEPVYEAAGGCRTCSGGQSSKWSNTASRADHIDRIALLYPPTPVLSWAP